MDLEKKKLQFKKNDEIVITIEDLGKDGEGIGHVDGYALFVKGALPGEKVLVHLMKLNKNYGFARLVEILEPSKERMTPSCPSASLCGGCTLQHFSYEGQLAFKEKKVKDCMERLGGVDLSSVTWLPILGMTGENESPWHYRNKAQFPVREDENGIPQTGFFAGRSHRLIPASSCAIQHPVINEVVETVMDFLRAYGISAYREESHKGLVRHIYVRRGYHTGQIMVCLVINGNELPHAAEFITRLRTIEGMASICLNLNTKKTNVILGPSTKLCGAALPSRTKSAASATRFRHSPFIRSIRFKPKNCIRQHSISLICRGMSVSGTSTAASEPFLYFLQKQYQTVR